MPNVPEYWLAPFAILPAGAGMHRVNWDLRSADPPTLNYGYSGTALDYREYTLSWHAIPGRTPRTTLVGPMVLPGTYTATLKVNGRSYTQQIAVVQDPRITVPASALAAQFRLQQRMVAGLGVTYSAVTYIQAVRAAAARLGAQGQSVEEALGRLENGPGSFGLAHRDLGRRLNDQLVADMELTPSVIAGVDQPCASIDAALDELRRLQATSLGELRAALARAGQPALPTWTPPPSPACGRK